MMYHHNLSLFLYSTCEFQGVLAILRHAIRFQQSRPMDFPVAIPRSLHQQMAWKGHQPWHIL